MKIKLNRSYKKLAKNGQPITVFVYNVSGSEEELNQYKDIQGDNFRESDTGTALWFSTRCVGNSGELIFTTSGKVVADMSDFDQADSLSKQYGGNLGQEMAKAAAARLMGGSVSTGNTATTAAPVASVKSEDLASL